MHYLSAIFVLLLSGCTISNDVSKIKFGGIEHTFSAIEDLKRVEFLSKNVRKKKWKIAYGFGCDSTFCSNTTIPYKDKNLLTPSEDKTHRKITKHIEEKISWALATWLAPLKELGISEGIITDKQFEFIELTPKPDEQSASGFIYYPDQLETNNLRNAVDLMVIIGGMINYASPKRARELFQAPLNVPPIVFMQHDAGINAVNTSKHWRYLLLHEMGHAFGLVDTYPDALADTRGQSAAVMSLALKQYQTQPALAADDIKGIQWLYYFFHDRKNLQDNECFFADYEVVTDDKGRKICRPTYPVIHEIKQAYLKEQHGNLIEARGFMASAIQHSANFNNRKDQHGRTALHYAVLHEGESLALKIDWRSTIKELLGSGFNRKIKDSANNIACNYLQCKDSADKVGTKVKCLEIRELLCL